MEAIVTKIENGWRIEVPTLTKPAYTSTRAKAVLRAVRELLDEVKSDRLVICIDDWQSPE